ncbi:SLBB domain-containing protein [Pseudoalteromonas sp. T1lg23B]|uniref:SLBB domain-containing protein n=1 Tax=Pseudoalteromonas sp. T1lg23B TaxID=2077097 RepID=UPI001319E5C7|nr:SLBB domain-containing protein [Pseudoalteromonas sp. T1lg23B]
MGLRLIGFLIFCSVFFASKSIAVQLSPKQLAYIKSLSASEKKELAEQYGVSVDDLGSNRLPKKKNNLLDELGEREEDDLYKEQIPEEEEKEQEDDELKLFGYDLFEKKNVEQGANLVMQAAPGNYPINVGDYLIVSFYGKLNITHEVQVSGDGQLLVPGLSPVNVLGLTLNEAKSLILSKVKQEVIGGEAIITTGELQPISITIAGEVKKPGIYTLPALTSITQALNYADGITELGSLRNIQQKRKGEQVSNLDLYDLLLTGDNSADTILRNGDVVFVPSIEKRVTVDGAINRPAIYELKSGEHLQDLLKIGGGISARGSKENITILRFTQQNRKTVVSVDISQKGDAALHDGDEIKIPAVSSELEKAVTLIGAVTHPGPRQWSKGLKLSKILTSLKSDLLPITDKNYALIIRENSEDSDKYVLQFSPKSVVAGTSDLELRSGDQVVFFSRFESAIEEVNELNRFAYVAEEVLEMEKDRLLEEYKREQFFESIGRESLLSSSSEQKSQPLTTREILQGKSLEVSESNYSLYSRQRLLRPIIRELNRQGAPDGAAPVVSVNGEVRYPGLYPLPVNASISGLLEAAGGLKESAYPEKIEVSRLAYEDGIEGIQHIELNLNKLTGNFKVNSKDVISVFSKPKWQDSSKIKIVGEVRFPGSYTLSAGESLSDVIQRAGGLTDYAFEGGAVFTREYLREQEQELLKDLSKTLRADLASSSFQKSVSSANLSYEDMDNLINDISQQEALGRMVIDLPKVIDNEQVILLRNGDTLFIPKKVDTVSVVGEVNVSTSMQYDPTMTLVTI